MPEARWDFNAVFLDLHPPLRAAFDPISVSHERIGGKDPAAQTRPPYEGCPPQLKIVIAPDKFKGTLEARQAACAIERGIRRVRPDLPPDVTVLCPIADGGDGTAAIVVEALGGDWVDLQTEDPLGRPIAAPVGVVRRNGRPTALVESAAASGLALLRSEEIDPVHASTFGTGKLIEACIGQRAAGLEDVSAIVVCVGGTATTDAGLGALRALGATLLDPDGSPLGPYDALLFETRVIDPEGLPSFARFEGGRFEVATDVANPMLGPRGAVAAFGPQKGVKPHEIPRFEEAMRRLCRLYAEVFSLDVSGLPRAGAGGGLAGGLAAACGAALTDGFALVSDAARLEGHLAEAGVVITGEGAVDTTSFEGKAIGKVVEMARLHDVKVAVIAGKIDEAVVPPRPPVEALVSLDSLAAYPEESLDNAAGLVEVAAARWAEEFFGGRIA